MSNKIIRPPKYNPIAMGNPNCANEYGKKMKKYLKKLKQINNEQ